MTPELHFEPIKQEAWYLQIVNEIQSSKRPMDEMSISQILQLYKERSFLCDTCGKNLDKNNFSLEDHIAHLINPTILWGCDNCLIDDLKHGRVIGVTVESNPKKWQLDNK